MPLKDTEVRALKALDKSYRRADGHGLYIEVFPNGSKLWRLKYRFAGKEKRLALGCYPEVSLAAARATRDQARAKLNQNIDPSLERKRHKAAAKFSAENSFGKIAEEYIASMRKNERADATVLKAVWFLSLLTPAIGAMPIKEIDPQMLLAVLRKLEAKGNHETAKKTRSFASRVFHYAAVTGRADADPTSLLKGSLTSAKAKHYAAILEPNKLGACLRAIDGYDGSPVTKLALQLLPHVFVRPGELRHADWSEIDFEMAIWASRRVRGGGERGQKEPANSCAINCTRSKGGGDSPDREIGSVGTKRCFRLVAYGKRS